MVYQGMKVRKTVDIEIPGLGAKIKAARESDRRSLSEICRQIEMSTMNWYKIEDEVTKALPLETLRNIEEVLGVDFGIDFEREQTDQESELEKRDKGKKSG